MVQDSSTAPQLEGTVLGSPILIPAMGLLVGAGTSGPKPRTMIGCGPAQRQLHPAGQTQRVQSGCRHHGTLRLARGASHAAEEVGQSSGGWAPSRGAKKPSQDSSCSEPCACLRTTQ